MSTKLYVGNLSFDATEADLMDLFGQAGTVTETVIINDKMTGRSRGFGFVTMADAEGAREAISQLDGKSIQGRNLTVNEAREREFTGGGGGGGGGNRGGGGGGGGYKDRKGGGGGGERRDRRY